MPDPCERSLAMLRAERDQLEAECDAEMRKLDELMRERIDLAARAEDLRAFEAEYWARLDAYLDGLLATLRMEGRV